MLTPGRYWAAYDEEILISTSVSPAEKRVEAQLKKKGTEQGHTGELEEGEAGRKVIKFFLFTFVC